MEEYTTHVEKIAKAIITMMHDFPSSGAVGYLLAASRMTVSNTLLNLLSEDGDEDGDGEVEINPSKEAEITLDLLMLELSWLQYAYSKHGIDFLGMLRSKFRKIRSDVAKIEALNEKTVLTDAAMKQKKPLIKHNEINYIR